MKPLNADQTEHLLASVRTLRPFWCQSCEVPMHHVHGQVYMASTLYPTGSARLHCTCGKSDVFPLSPAVRDHIKKFTVPDVNEDPEFQLSWKGL